MLAEGRTSLSPADLKAYGAKRFLAEQAQRGPLRLSKLHFTVEENQVMDELLAAEKILRLLLLDTNPVIGYIRQGELVPAETIISVVVAAELEVFALKAD